VNSRSILTLYRSANKAVLRFRSSGTLSVHSGAVLERLRFGFACPTGRRLYNAKLKRPLRNLNAFTFLLLATFLFLASSALAEAPVPERKETAAELRKELGAKTSEKKDLARKSAQAEKVLKDTRRKMIKLGKRMQGSEKALIDLERKILELEGERKEIGERLDGERASIAKLAMALQRMSRMPPQAMLARPGAPLETAQTAMLIRDIIPAIKKKTDALKDDLERVADIDEETREKKESVERTVATLQKEEKELNTLVASRERYYKAANRDLVAKQQDIERISLKAKSLEDLVARLNKREEEERTRRISKPKSKRRVIKALPRAGKAQSPVPGRILVAYKEPDAFGAPSEGITIEGRSRALVVAPMGGIVRFTGYFKNYGTMVIIEHENKYHSLIAGFEKVDTLVGQRVGVGEPLGKLRKKKNGKVPKLYYELRKNSKPVNPATRLSGIG